MNDFMTIGPATSPVLSLGWTGEAAGARRTARPIQAVKGTSLPVVGRTALAGVVMEADQAQGTGVFRVRPTAVPGIPPRRVPVRC